MGYKEYCSVQERAGRQSFWCKFEDLLQRILTEAPSVYRLVLTHRNRFTQMTDLELAKYCPSETCRFPRQMHAIFRLTPQQSLGTSRSPDIVRTMLSILPVGTRKVKELVMEPTDSIDGSFKVLIERFDGPSCFMLKASDLMANLIKLRLDIDELGNRSMQQTRALVRCLAQAVNLECLALRFEDTYNDGSLRLPLSDCQLLKLRILVLEHVGIPGDELLLFITNSPKSKHIVLDRCWMDGYRWIDLINGIKDLGTLDALRVSHCFEGFSAPDWLYGDTFYHFAELDKNGRRPNYVAQRYDTPLLLGDAPPASITQLYYHEYF